MGEDKNVKKVIEDFRSSKKETVLKAISENRKVGNEASFKALLQLLKDTDEPEVETAIIAFLYDLKDESSIPHLISAIRDADFEYYRSFLVATFWQSALEAPEELEVFVEAAIKSDYLTCLEALTVIENFDSSFSEAELLDNEAALSEAINDEENEQKKNLLISLRDVVRNLPLEGE